MRSYFDDLRRKKEFLEKRNLSIRIIAEETGLSQGAILRVKNMTMERMYLSTIWTLCGYFDVKSICDLIELTSADSRDRPTKPVDAQGKEEQIKTFKMS